MILCIGDLAVDVIVRLRRDDIDPTSDTPAEISQHRGGSAANVAAVSARLGRRARFAGVVADDEPGLWLRQRMEALQVEIDSIPGARSTTIVVLVDSAGQRCFLTDSGEYGKWPQLSPSLLDGVSRLYFTGYALCDSRSTAACLDLAAMANARGIPIAVDPSSVSVVAEFGVDQFVRMMAKISPSILLPNWEESCQLEAVMTSHPELRWVPPLTVTTCGTEPAVARWADGTEISAPAPEVGVIDTTGAGDAFSGGFLAALDRHPGMNRRTPTIEAVVAAMESGHSAAARVVSGASGDYWSETASGISKGRYT